MSTDAVSSRPMQEKDSSNELYCLADRSSKITHKVLKLRGMKSDRIHGLAPRSSTQQTGCLRGLLSVFKPSSFRSMSQKAPEDEGVVVQPPQDQQEFEGWGTSLCWFANVVGGFPDPLRHQLMDLLFDKKMGLGLEICRYNIGGSGWSNRDKGNFRYGADIASFWGPDGSWDWEQDANQRWVLLQARRRGAIHFEAFSNSPPYWMTYSGRGSGNNFAWLDNLPPKHYDDFVFYLKRVVEWYKDTYNLTFRTIDPFNEPSSNYWWAGNNQEGCHFGIATQNVIIVKLWKSLMEAGLVDSGVGISASDETNIDTACQSLYGYTPEALACIAQINTHCYAGTRRQELRDLAKAAGKRLWMSEVGYGGHSPEDVWAGLDISRCILADLNTMQVNGWVYWQAIENNDGGTWWGLLQVPFHEGAASIRIGKQYFCMLQYTRFIRSGWTILSTNRPDTTLAATLSNDSKLRAIVLVVSNFDNNERTDHFDLTHFGRDGVHIRVWRTSQTENLVNIESFSGHTKFKYKLPPTSITTFSCHVENSGYEQ